VPISYGPERPPPSFNQAGAQGPYDRPPPVALEDIQHEQADVRELEDQGDMNVENLTIDAEEGSPPMTDINDSKRKRDDQGDLDDPDDRRNLGVREPTFHRPSTFQRAIESGEAGLERPRNRSRSPPREVPRREESFWGWQDFEGSPGDHVEQAWFGTERHEFAGTAICVELDIDVDEIHDEMSISDLIR
jgi:hypothetical protein